jgi:hypothetical protein
MAGLDSVFPDFVDTTVQCSKENTVLFSKGIASRCRRYYGTRVKDIAHEDRLKEPTGAGQRHYSGLMVGMTYPWSLPSQRIAMFQKDSYQSPNFRDVMPLSDIKGNCTVYLGRGAAQHSRETGAEGCPSMRMLFT